MADSEASDNIYDLLDEAELAEMLFGGVEITTTGKLAEVTD